MNFCGYDLRRISRYLPLTLLLLVGGVSLWWGIEEGLLPVDALLRLHDTFQNNAELYFWRTALFYILLYALVVSVALPGGMVMTLAGGYLFGPLTGTLLALLGACTGGLITFFAVHSALGELLSRRAGGRLDRIRIYFMQSPARNLLLLRLSTIFPFFMINIAAALFGVRFFLFFWTMVLGLIPSTIAFSLIGSGLSRQLEEGGLPGLEILLEPIVLVPALLLMTLVVVTGKVRQAL